MISIIIPVYNSEKYLEACIKSVLNQSYTDFELLLINDGSSDNSGKICDRFASQDKRIRCFHRQNTGVGNTRNFGIEQARGEWICFIDSDDEVRPNYLIAFDTESTCADIVITGINFINVQTSNVIRKECYTPSIIRPDIDRNALVPFLTVGFPFAKAYRRDFLIKNQLRFPTDISFHEDHVFVLDCFLSCKAVEIKENVTYLYRIDYSQQSLSKKKHPWQKHWKASNYMFDRIFKIKENLDMTDNDLENVYTFAYEPVISAVYDLYDQPCGKRERKETLRKLLKDSLPISKYYFPISGRGKLLKFVAKTFPLSILDLFFLAVNKYQNRRK